MGAHTCLVFAAAVRYGKSYSLVEVLKDQKTMKTNISVLGAFIFAMVAIEDINTQGNFKVL